MRLPALAERELRIRSRRWGFYWLRGLLALAAGLQAYELLNGSVLPSVAGAGGAAGLAAGAALGSMLLRQMVWLVLAGAALMALLGADSISRERREGTLGLLLLTDLGPAQIVYGKMLSHGLMSFVVLVGVVPALMLPVLAGGVSGTEAALTGLAVLNTLFVALAAGMWMSARFRERHHAVLTTLAILAVLSIGFEILGVPVLGVGAVPFLRLFELGGWMTWVRVSFPRNLGFVLWFGLYLGLGWFFLRQAARSLAANWQDEPHKQVRDPEPAAEWPTPAPAEEQGPDPTTGGEVPPADAGASWLNEPRPWDFDPVRWRVQRRGSAEGLLWVAVALDFFAQLGAVGSVFDSNATFGGAWGILSFFGTAAILIASAMLAAAGARFFQDSRRLQDLELLLTTPLGRQDIVRAQWRVLRRGLGWPLGLALAVATPSGIAAIYDFAQDNLTKVWFYLPAFLITTNLVVEVVALCWVGMCFGLRARNIMSAVVMSVAAVQLLPMGLALGLMGSWTWLVKHVIPFPLAGQGMPAMVPALLFFLTKNLLCMVWARTWLRRSLRLGVKTPRLHASARGLVWQPA